MGGWNEIGTNVKYEIRRLQYLITVRVFDRNNHGNNNNNNKSSALFFWPRGWQPCASHVHTRTQRVRTRLEGIVRMYE